MTDLPDIQDSGDKRGVSLDNVGVTNLTYPITVRQMDLGEDPHPALLSTVGKFEASVRLPKVQRGTHMSRLVKVVDGNAGKQMSLIHLQGVAVELCKVLEASASRIVVDFEYFMPKTAPVSHEVGYMNYSCTFEATSHITQVWDTPVESKASNMVSSWLSVTVPVMSLCPCSKEISDYGAHNQRCHVTVKLSLKDPTDFIWIEEVVELVEQCGSSPVYPILKRPDERHVTMTSYDNPAFVEDVARNVVVKLKQDERVLAYHVEVKSRESIHNHDAFARVNGTNRED